MKNIKLIISAAVIISLMAGAATAYAAAANFSDLKATNWAYKNVNSLVSKGGISGYPDNTFRPNNTITNAEFIKILVSITLGEQPKAGGHWATGYMDKAAASGIIKEDELKESAWNKPMTRQSMSVAIARTSEFVLKEEMKAEKAEELKRSIKDFNSLREDYKDYVLAVYEKGIITGYPDGTFGPEKTATRAEASAMIVRLIEKEQRVLPSSEKKLDELISNKDFMEEYLKNVTTYKYDPNVSKYELSYKVSKGTTLLKCRDLYVLGLIKDGKIVEVEVAIPIDTNGTRAATIKTDITTVDYILSYQNSSGNVIVIQNPLKK